MIEITCEKCKLVYSEDVDLSATPKPDVLTHTCPRCGRLKQFDEQTSNKL